ncbi:tryptophan-rich sensory protein TspO [Albidovulum sp.]|uniref:tryptophan-rich sensory protein TspO n=1 Tax=Albidovulum sp. TaxID=1872424 RepID=UPI0039B93AFC
MQLTTPPGFLGACLAAAATGMIFRPGSWYRSLRKPAWTPPDGVFPTVWTLLYILIALAATRVAGLGGNGTALSLRPFQIALNTLWTPVFFGGRYIRAGLVVIVLLWLAVVLTLAAFWALDWVAAIMLVPHLAWLSLAVALKFRVWRDNPVGG